LKAIIICRFFSIKADLMKMMGAGAVSEAVKMLPLIYALDKGSKGVI
jgi:hypothetical protein